MLRLIPLEALIIALLIGIIRAGMLSTWRLRWDSAIRWMLLLPVGIGGLWGFLFHSLFADLSATFIGWAPSPFQYEVAAANLGLGLVGVVGFLMRKRPGYWIAATLMVCCFLWGAAVVHIREMVLAHNFAPGNAGAIFYTDLAIPLILAGMVVAWHSSADV